MIFHSPHPSQKQWEQSECRASAQRGELSSVRETHQQGEVEKQLLEGERTQLTEALARVRKTHALLLGGFYYPSCILSLSPPSLFQAESSNAELSLLVNKLRSEEAALRDSLSKMGSMNEGLAQDKTDLNTIISQVRHQQQLSVCVAVLVCVEFTRPWRVGVSLASRCI